MHLKQVNPDIISEVLDKDLSVPGGGEDGRHDRAAAGRAGHAPVLEALAGLDRELKGIIEHDLYPCAPDVPLPIAKRTRTYLSSCSNVAIDMGAARERR